MYSILIPQRVDDKIFTSVTKELIFNCLTVYEYSNMSRIGGNTEHNDGGYVICSDFNNYDILISAGIGGDITFEKDVTERYNIKCMAYDGECNSATDICSSEELITHIPKNISNINSEKTTNLKDSIQIYKNVFLKMDIGYNRTGVDSDDDSLIQDLLNQMRGVPFIDFKGFLGHAGHSYLCRSKEAIEEVHQKSKEKIIQLKTKYKAQYPGLILSLGDTPSCSVSEDFKGIDEIRPGNFVFYDLTQNIIGSNELDDVAVAMACPIVAKHPKRNELVIYGGGVHFSKDRVEDPKDGLIFGRVAEKNNLVWGSCLPDVFLKSLSQEHGIVSVPAEKMTAYEIGDFLWVLPVHSCMAADLMNELYTPKGRVISMM